MQSGQENIELFVQADHQIIATMDSLQSHGATLETMNAITNLDAANTPKSSKAAT